MKDTLHEMSIMIADRNRQIAQLKDQLADQSLLKAEILRLGRENKELEDKLKDGLVNAHMAGQNYAGVVFGPSLQDAMKYAEQLEAAHGDTT